MHQITLNHASSHFKNSNAAHLTENITMRGLFRRLSTLPLWVCCSALIFGGCDDEEKKEALATAAVVAVVSVVMAVGGWAAIEDDDQHHDDRDHRDDRDHKDKKDDRFNSPPPEGYNPDFGDEYANPRARRRYCQRHPDAFRCDEVLENREESWRYERCNFRKVCYQSYDYHGDRVRHCEHQSLCRSPKDLYWHQHGDHRYHGHRGGRSRGHYHERYFSSPSHPLEITQVDIHGIRTALATHELTEVVSPFDFGHAHHLSVELASRLLDGIERARNGDIEGLYELGFSDEDLTDLAHLRLPPPESIDRIALELDLLPPLTTGMIARMIKHARHLSSATATTDLSE